MMDEMSDGSRSNGSRLGDHTFIAHRASRRVEKPISDVYPVIDNDLARDNVENDFPAADRKDLR